MEQLEQAKQATKQAEQATKQAEQATKQAIVESEAKSKAETAAKKVAHLLGRRFEKVSYQLIQALLKIDDLDKLDKLFDLAFDCKTLNEFATALK